LRWLAERLEPEREDEERDLLDDDRDVLELLALRLLRLLSAMYFSLCSP